MSTSERLFESCSEGRLCDVDSLLCHGACVDSQDEDGRTGLILSCVHGHEGIVSLLLGRGARTDICDSSESTALIHACVRGEAGIVQMLLDHGANANVCGEFGRPPLTVACLAGHEAVVDVLLKLNNKNDNHADVNGCDEFGKTALIEVCSTASRTTKSCRDYVTIMKTLMRHGADVSVCDRQGRTPLLEACLVGNEDIVEALVVEHEADVDRRDTAWTTPLMQSCTSGHDKIVEFLIQKGADLDSQDNNDQTAVMMAVIRNQVKCLEILLSTSRDLNLDLNDAEGRTVFSHALKNPNTNCLRLLLVEGFLISGGNLKPVHKYAHNPLDVKEPYLVMIELGFFEWELCPLEYYEEISIAALRSGLCPGKIQYGFDCFRDDCRLSPLVVAFLERDKELVQTFLRHCYYFREDYRTLCWDEDTREQVSIWNPELLDQFVGTPLSLQTWSFLTVSEAISLAGPPRYRRERVDLLPLPDKLKRSLKFEL